MQRRFGLVGRIERSEQQLGQLIPALPVALAAIALAYGVDPKLTAVTSAVLFLWPWYVNSEGPTVQESPEYAFLRSKRVKLYLAGLLFLIPSNLILFFYVPAFFAILAVVAIAYVLAAIYGVAILAWKKDLDIQGREEEDFAKEMVASAGGASIYLSWGVIGADLISSFQLAPIWVIVFGVAGAIAAYVFLGARVIDRESTSRSNARSLADSYRKRHWIRRFKKKRGD